MLTAVLMVAVTSGGGQEPGVTPAVIPPAAVQQNQQGAPPVVSQDTVPSAAPAQTPAPQMPNEKQVFTVPAGTRIPLTLAQAINPRYARRGDAIRAVTAFPVTVGGQVAMPSGVLMEGVVDKLVKKDRYGHPWVKAHFTRMIFPNGTVLPLEGTSSEARAIQPSEDESVSASLDAQADSRAEHAQGPSAAEAFQFPPQQTTPPTLPPLPKPNYGPAIGVGVAAAAAAVAIAIIASHHRYDYFWYDVGWQFDMVLQAPIQVDAGDWSGDAGS